MKETITLKILIVEDDETLMGQNVIFCNAALQSIQMDDLELAVEILEAPTLEAAIAFIEEYGSQIAFASVDIALSKSEVGKSDTQIAQEKFVPGGMQVLERLKGNDTLAVIKSGEKAQTYLLNAWIKYNVLTFFVKGEDDPEQYMAAVQAAIWYKIAQYKLNLPLELLDVADLEPIEFALDQSQVAAEKANIPRMPNDAHNKLQQIQSAYLHHDTKLPVGEWTDAKLQKYIIGEGAWSDADQLSWTFVRFSMNGFTQFINNFGSQREGLMVLFGRIVQSVAQTVYKNQPYFVGHLHPDSGGSEPFLIVFADSVDVPLAERMAKDVESRFDEQISRFLPDDQLHGKTAVPHYPIKVDHNIWNSEEDSNDFADVHQIDDTVSKGKG